MDFNISLVGILVFFVCWKTAECQGFVHYPDTGVSYEFHAVAKNWSQALEACNKGNHSLAMPTTFQELLNIKSMFHGYPDTLLPDNAEKNMIHLGFHSLFAENEHLTLSGQPVEELVFTVTESSNSQCGTMLRGGLLTTKACDVLAGYVCESTIKKPEQTYDPKCRSSTYEYKASLENCYRHHKSLKSWADARSICREEDAHLLVIDSSEEESVIVDMISLSSNRTWAGFHDIFTEGIFRTDTGGYLHSSLYVNWNDGQPNGGTAENCGAISEIAELHDENCDTRYTFICEKKAIKVETEEERRRRTGYYG